MALMLLLLMALSFASGGTVQASPMHQGTGGLFLPAPDAPNVTLSPTAVESRPVYIDYQIISTVKPGDALPLNLFPDTAYTAVIDSIQSGVTGATIWTGHLKNVEMSLVVLVMKDGVMMGQISSPEGIYQVRYAQEKRHQILKIDQSTYPPEMEPISIDSIEASILAPVLATDADDGSLIDILVVYSPEAKTQVGSATAIENLIELAVAETNASYENSQVSQRIALVHVEEIAGAVNNFEDDLPAIRDPNDGKMDNVHPMRNTYHADNVVLIIHDTDYCGLAYHMSSVNTGFESDAFATVHWDCATGNYSFGHELGHNMGARHDWYVDDGTTPYGYVHGYVHSSYDWRTIMAYGNECSDHGTSCTRLQYWSNPAVSYGGAAMGVAAGTSTSCNAGTSYPPGSECDADNHLTLDTTASTTDQFRSSEYVWVGNTTDWNSASNWNTEEGAPGATTTVHRVPRTIDDVVIPSSPVGGNFPTIAGGTANVRDLTIENNAQLTLNSGTLNVYGNWEETGSGQFNGQGGTVAFVGKLPQTITANAASVFPNVTIGDGTGNQLVLLKSDLDINGNLVIQDKASFNADLYTIEIAGNWTETGTFVSGTSTVIFDGASQTVDRTVTTLSIIDEAFHDADNAGGSYSTSKLPSGWVREQSSGSGFLGGNGNCDDGAAVKWNNSSDAWLFTTSFHLEAGVDYSLSYKYRLLQGGGASQEWSTYIGQQQNSASMTQLLGTTGAVAPSNCTTKTENFTVATSGTYYLGIRVQDGSGSNYATVDDVLLTGTFRPTFYNAQIKSTGATTFNKDVTIWNDLSVFANAVLDLNGHDVTVDGSTTNNGKIKNTLQVNAGSTTEFMHIKNKAGNADKYHGVDITPSGSMGDVTVEIRGNQSKCNVGDEIIHRCYDISPTTSASATIKFWYLNAEHGNETVSQMKAYHWNGSSWDTLTSTRGTTSGYEWVEASGVSSYSPFGLADGNPAPPTTVKLVQIQGRELQSITLLLGGLLMLGLGAAALGWAKMRQAANK
jgi:hypothetical protein